MSGQVKPTRRRSLLEGADGQDLPVTQQRRMSLVDGIPVESGVAAGGTGGAPCDRKKDLGSEYCEVTPDTGGDPGMSGTDTEEHHMAVFDTTQVRRKSGVAGRAVLNRAERERRDAMNTFDRMLLELVERPLFETVVGVIIMLNCITIGMEADLCPGPTSIRFKGIDDTVSDTCPQVFLDVAEHTFTALFLLEFFVHLRCRGVQHFMTWANFADAMLVWVTGVLLVWVIKPHFADMISAREFRALTVLRALRLFRLAHVVKYMPEFKEMFMLLRGLADSSLTLMWTAVVICFISFLFATLFAITVGDHEEYLQMQLRLDNCTVNYQGEDPDFCIDNFPEPKVAKKYFSSVPMIMFTLLQIMTGDSWAEAIVRPVNSEQPGMWLPFVTYVALASFVLLNLVTAVIVNNAFAISRQDKELLLQKKMATKLETIQELGELFIEMDTDGSGDLTLEELQHAFENNQKVRQSFLILDIAEDQAEQIFALLDVTEDNHVNTKEFLHGMTRVMNDITAFDIVSLQASLGRFKHGMTAYADKHIKAQDTVGELHEMLGSIKEKWAAGATPNLVNAAASPDLAQATDQLQRENDALEALLRELKSAELSAPVEQGVG